MVGAGWPLGEAGEGGGARGAAWEAARALVAGWGRGVWGWEEVCTREASMQMAFHMRPVMVDHEVMPARWM